MSQELLLPFRLEWPELSLALQLNLLLALAGCVGFIVLLRSSLHVALRPAFIVGLLAHVTYQWPAVLFTPVLSRGLSDSALFFAACHCAVLVPLAWLFLTRTWSIDIATPLAGTPAPSAREATPASMAAGVDVPSPMAWIVFGALFLSLAYYLLRIDMRCTALFAMIFDPRAGLLAREVAGKLLSTPFDAYLFGLVINVLAPLAQFVAVIRLDASLRALRFVPALAWFGLSIAMLFAVLITGAKGNLLASAVAIAVALMTSPGSLVLKAGKVAATGIVTMIALSVVESNFERSLEGPSGCYPLGGCVAAHNACAPARTLVTSLWARDEALGMTRQRMVLLERDLDAACGIGSAPPRNRDLMCVSSARPTNENLLGAVVEVERRATPIPKERALHVPAPPSALDGMLAQHRLLEIGSGVLRRATVVPLQVASWHHRYSEEFGAPGFRAFPVVSQYFGGRVIMPIEVYRAYYAVYSAGDRTATGTAPTGFLVGYPAYLGFAGIVLAAVLLLAFDAVATLALRGVQLALRYVGAAMLAVASVNFMASDFTTALASHAGGAGLLALVALALAQRFGSSR